MTSIHIELRPAGVSIQAAGIQNKKEEANEIFIKNTEPVTVTGSK